MSARTTSAQGKAKSAAPKPRASKTAAPEKAAAVRKPPSKPGTSARKAGIAAPDERLRLIAETAYYRAERRSFTPGNELADWLEAEAEVDALPNPRGES
jgi:hypothetical protein